MRSRTKYIVVASVAVVAAALFTWLGFWTALMSGSGGMSYDDSQGMAEKAMVGAPMVAAEGGATTEVLSGELRADSAAPVSDETAGSTVDSLVIRTASIDIRVPDVDAAIVELRGAVAGSGAEISNMNVYRGDSGVAIQGDPEMASVGPASASVTIRVPANKLQQLERNLADLGTVVSQSSSADDVTEQAIDLDARLKNLRAEEARLREFLERATKISELLEVERELARVRGEIESIDAQLTYLTRQAARATLTVTLSEPAPIAQPTTISWGLREAFTRGVKATAALVSVLVTALVPVSVLVLLGIAVALPIRFVARRRAAKRAQEDGAQTDAEQESGQ